MATISRAHYAEIYGPTKGDMVRLGDTGLLAEIEHDFTVYGDELTTGAGKSMRDGEGFQTTGTYASGALDMVIQNATVIDPVLGIVKGDIGIRDGRIVGIGKAGNPDIMDGVAPSLRTGPNTTVVHGDFYIATAGGVEAHAHFLSPQQCDHALAGGITTMIGMSPGPHFDVSCSGPNVLGELIRAADEYCLNFGFLGRGASDPGAVEETVAGGALGVKIHEDFGASSAVIDGSLIAADRNDFAVHLHTDTINEFGFCEDTLAAIDGRTIHMYHTEGAGGGHAPDLLRVNGFANVIPSSTNPTNPFTAYALNEGVPMTMLAHVLNFRLPEDVAFAESRIRAADHGGGGPAARHGRHLDLRHRHPGHGPAGRERRQVLAARQRHEGARRAPADREDGAGRQRAHQALRRQVHDQPGARRRDRGACRFAGAGPAGRHRAVAAQLVRRQAVDGHQGRLHRLGRDGRRQRQPDQFRADHPAADVGRAGHGQAQARLHLRFQAGGGGRCRAQAGRPEARSSRSATSGASPSATCCTTTRCPISRSIPRPSTSTPTARC